MFSQCPRVQIVQVSNVQVSKCPNVQVSKCPNFQVFKFPNVQESKCLCVQVPKCPSVQVSKSKCPNVKVLLFFQVGRVLRTPSHPQDEFPKLCCLISLARCMRSYNHRYLNFYPGAGSPMHLARKHLYQSIFR